MIRSVTVTVPTRSAAVDAAEALGAKGHAADLVADRRGAREGRHTARIWMETDLQKLLRNLGACDEAYRWVAGRTLHEAWAECQRPYWMLWLLNAVGYRDERILRLYACWCVRQVWHLLTDPRSREAVETAERYARGDATNAELATARDDALAAASDADAYAASDTAAWAARAASWAARAAWSADVAARAARAARAAYIAWSAYNADRADRAARAAAGAAAGTSAWATLVTQADRLREAVPWTVVEELAEAAAITA